MKYHLICSQQIQLLLQEALSRRGCTYDPQAEMSFVEAGYPIPSDQIAIVFDAGNIAALLEFVNDWSGHKDEINKIVGRYADDRYSVISLEQVFYFEARDNNTFCVTPTGECRIKEKLYELEAKLPPDKFIRVSKSFIVNIENVKDILPWFGRRLILRFTDSKLEVEVSKNYVKAFREFLGF